MINLTKILFFLIALFVSSAEFILAKTSKKTKLPKKTLETENAYFALSDLETGVSVTILPDKPIVISLRNKVQLTGTDREQKISIGLIGIDSSSETPVVLDIFDKSADRVINLSLKPNVGVVYPLDSLKSITVVPSRTHSLSESLKQSVKVKIESRQPLTITRLADI